jgi:hypothetical protein
VPQSATTDSGENASAGFARYFAVNGCRMAASLAVAVTTPLVAGCGSTQRHVTAHVKPPVYCLVGAAVRYPTAAQQKAAIARRIRFLQERHDPCASTEIPAYERDLHSVKAAPDVVGERLDRAQAELRADGLTHFGTGYGGPLARSRPRERLDGLRHLAKARAAATSPVVRDLAVRSPHLQQLATNLGAEQTPAPTVAVG